MTWRLLIPDALPDTERNHVSMYITDGIIQEINEPSTGGLPRIAPWARLSWRIVPQIPAARPLAWVAAGVAPISMHIPTARCPAVLPEADIASFCVRPQPGVYTG